MTEFEIIEFWRSRGFEYLETEGGIHVLKLECFVWTGRTFMELLLKFLFQ